MQTLIIKDLALSCDLGHKEMSTVRGGHNAGGYKMDLHSCSPFSMPSYAPSVNATQNLTQLQDVQNLTANGSAFISGVDVTNNTSQFGQNNVLVA